MSAKKQSARTQRASKPITPRKSPAVAARPGIPSETTKADTILALLRRSGGASIAELGKATGWQPHSLRGFISGTLKKKQGLDVKSQNVRGVLHYHVVKGA